MAINLNGKQVAILGGSGTFGRALARRILEAQRPDRLVIYSRGEHAQAVMRDELDGLDVERGLPLRFFLGDVRDLGRLKLALRGVTHVFHAAALKRIEACEYNPQEAVATNIIGSSNVVRAAIDCDVQRVLAISSDKAAAPTTLYGVTKLAMERIFSASNVLSGHHGPRFSSVRYGNVLGSAGSVLPKFYELAIRGEELPVIDPAMTRFFWPIEAAADFALAAMDAMMGGEVMVPKMRSMSVAQLVGGISRALGDRVITCRRMSARPSEKRDEVLITAVEASMVHDLDDMYALAPSEDWMPPYAPLPYSTRLYPGGDYASHLERCRMSDAEATDMVVEVIGKLYGLDPAADDGTAYIRQAEVA